MQPNPGFTNEKCIPSVDSIKKKKLPLPQSTAIM